MGKEREVLISPVRGQCREGAHSNQLHLNYVVGFSDEIVIFKMVPHMLIINFRSTSKIQIQNKVFPYEISCAK